MLPTEAAAAETERQALENYQRAKAKLSSTDSTSTASNGQVTRTYQAHNRYLDAKLKRQLAESSARAAATNDAEAQAEALRQRELPKPTHVVGALRPKWNHLA